MQKGFRKVLVALLACVSLLCCFFLAGCDDDKPRTLDDVERLLVGKWASVGLNGDILDDEIVEFLDDGTCTASWATQSVNLGKYWHDGYGLTDEGAYYDVIKTNNHTLALFNYDVNTLYYIHSDNTFGVYLKRQ